MNIKEYAYAAKEFDIHPEDSAGDFAVAFGLASECGEVMGKISKAIRDGWELDQFKKMVSYELGDMFWYACILMLRAGIDPDEVLQDNIVKLADRKKRGKIQGSGDTR